MILIIFNMTASPLSYLGGLVTVPSSSSTTVSEIYKFRLATDGQLRSDCLKNVAQLGDGTGRYGTIDAINYLEEIPQNLDENVRQQIFMASDLLKTFNWADFGTTTERITSITYTSALYSGITITKTFAYTLISGKYELNTITWSVT